MQRINKHKFELNNEEYLLTWYDKPRDKHPIKVYNFSNFLLNNK